MYIGNVYHHAGVCLPPYCQVCLYHHNYQPKIQLQWCLRLHSPKQCKHSKTKDIKPKSKSGL